MVSNLVSFGALFGFMVLNLSVIWKFYITGQHRTVSDLLKHCISPLIGFGVSAWIFLNLSIDAKLVGAAWLAVGLVILIIKTKFFSVRTPKLDFTSKN